MHGGASWPALIPGFVLIGIGVGLATPTFSSAAMGAVPPQRGGMAAGAVNTARQLGFALGIAALGSVFAARAAHVLGNHRVPSSDRVSRALAGGQAKVLLAKAPTQFHARLNDALHAAAVQGVQWAFLVSGIAGVLAGLAVLVMLRPVEQAATDDPTTPSTPDVGRDEVEASVDVAPVRSGESEIRATLSLCAASVVHETAHARRRRL